jgi:hypothetical protein
LKPAIEAVAGLVPWEESGPCQIATGAVVGPDHQDTGQLALRSGGRLERDGTHPADLGQGLLELPQKRQRALGQLVGHEGVEVREASESSSPLVHLGVEFHGARAERIEAGVDGVVELAQVHVVAGQLRLGDLGEMGAVDAELVGRNPRQRVLGRMRDLPAAASGP